MIASAGQHPYLVQNAAGETLAGHADLLDALPDLRRRRGAVQVMRRDGVKLAWAEPAVATLDRSLAVRRRNKLAELRREVRSERESRRAA